ncbi:MAG: hypothetical protein U1D30_26735 [Planctomycetota bacterium]
MVDQYLPVRQKKGFLTVIGGQINVSDSLVPGPIPREPCDLWKLRIGGRMEGKRSGFEQAAPAKANLARQRVHSVPQGEQEVVAAHPLGHLDVVVVFACCLEALAAPFICFF